MSEKHPLLEELLTICSERRWSARSAHLAFEVYLHLCEVLKLYDVQWHNQDSSINFYLTGKTNSEENDEIFIPVTSSEEITMRQISALQELTAGKLINLAVRDGDSSIVLYKISQGLNKPLSIEESQLRKDFEAKKSALEHEISHHERHIYTKALNQGWNN